MIDYMIQTISENKHLFQQEGWTHVAGRIASRAVASLRNAQPTNDIKIKDHFTQIGNE